MGTITYERPREKLFKRGVSVLTNAELLQVIIGSGNAGMPVTKIARNVEKALKKSKLTIAMGDLTAIQGLGVVKAGQILAGLELATRLTYQQDDVQHKGTDVLAELYGDIRTSKRQMLLYAFFDGSGRLLDTHSEVLNPKASTAHLARKLFAKALGQPTASILIAIGGEGQHLEPSMFELNVARDIYSTANMLSITVKAFVLVSPSGEHTVKEVHHA